MVADKQIDNGRYDEALHDLANVIPSEYGKHKYLVFYTIGRAARYRGREQIDRWKNQNKNADGMMRITAGEIYERYRNNIDCQLAKKSFWHSIELNPQFSPAYKHLAECLSNEARYAESFKVADLLVKMVPRCATAYKLRGGNHSALAHHLEALADFETAAELGPNDPETYWNIGQECLTLRENAKAIEAYETAIQLKSHYAGMCRYNMGIANKRMGKYEQAIACFEEAKKLGECPQWCDEEISECHKRLE